MQCHQILAICTVKINIFATQLVISSSLCRDFQGMVLEMLKLKYSFFLAKPSWWYIVTNTLSFSVRYFCYKLPDSRHIHTERPLFTWQAVSTYRCYLELCKLCGFKFILLGEIKVMFFCMDNAQFRYFTQIFFLQKRFHITPFLTDDNFTHMGKWFILAIYSTLLEINMNLNCESLF